MRGFGFIMSLSRVAYSERLVHGFKQFSFVFKLRWALKRGKEGCHMLQSPEGQIDSVESGGVQCLDRSWLGRNQKNV